MRVEKRDGSIEEVSFDKITTRIVSLCNDVKLKRMSLINIIASGVYFLVVVLAISDCANHMAEGGTKDSKFISNDLFLPHLKRIDPKKRIIDLIAFDVAAKFQKASRNLFT